MSATGRDDGRGRVPVDAVYAEFRRRREAGESLDFETFVAGHREHETALRVLHSAEGGAVESPEVEALDGFLRDQLAAGGSLAPGGVGRDEDLPLPPRSAHRYSARREIARGGMGVVYEVWDEELGRPLAMKVVRPARSPRFSGATPPLSRALLERFLNEARVTGRIDHPGVVPVHELGTDEEGRIYFTMPLVRGRDLKSVIDLSRRGEEGWSQTRVLEILARVCETVAYAHTKKIIHRDLKPANVMVGPFGETYVMDWGLAKILGQSDRRDLRLRPGEDETELQGASAGDSSGLVTLDGTVIGTPAFMPPEQAAGRIEDLDERSDIYSVGAMLYCLLTGRQPYVDTTEAPSSRAVLSAIAKGPPTPVSRRGGDVSPELVAICDKAMARQKSMRYATMAEMSEDIRAYLEHRVVRAHRTGTMAELQKWVARNRGVAFSTVAAAVLLLLGLAAFIVWQRGAMKELATERDEKARAVTRVETLLGEKEEALDDAEGLRLTALASLTLPDDPATALLIALEAARRRPGTLVNNTLLEILGELREERTLIVHSDFLTSLDYSPDGKRLVTTSRDDTVAVWDTETGRLLLRMFGDRFQINVVRFSPDGRRILSGSWSGKVLLWDAETGALLRTHELGGVVDHAEFSPDGSLIVASGRGNEARIWDATNGAEVATLRHEGWVHHVAFDPSGSRVVTASHDGAARVWTTDGKELFVLGGHREGVTHVEASPDGSALATAAMDGSVYIWSLVTGERTASLDGHRSWVRSAEFSRDGQRLVTASADGTARVWNVVTGDVIADLRGHRDELYTAEFDVSGNRVVTASRDQTARIWDAVTGEQLAALRGHKGAIREARFRPDGLQIATASDDFTARLWRADTADLMAGERRSARWNGSVSWAPDLDRVVVYAMGSVAEVRETVAGRLITSLEGHGDWIQSARFSPDGERIVTASWDGTAGIWHARTGELLQRLEGHRNWVHSGTFSEDSRRVVTTSLDYTARIWDVATGRLVRELPRHGWGTGIHDACFSADGKRVATVTGDYHARIWDVDSGRLLLALRHDAAWSVDRAAFSPGGRWLITFAWDKVVRLWDSQRGTLVARLSGHSRDFLAAVFDSDESLVVTLCTDATARVWTVPSGQPVAIVRCRKGHFVSARFVGEGRELETRSSLGVTRRWPLNPYPVAIDRRPREFMVSARNAHAIGTPRERREHEQAFRRDTSRRAWRAAQEMFERAPDNESVRSHVLRASEREVLSLSSGGLLTDALRVARSTVELDGDRDHGALTRLGRILERTGKPREAIVTLERAVRLPDRDPATPGWLRDLRREFAPDLASIASVDAALADLDRQEVIGWSEEWRLWRGLEAPKTSGTWTSEAVDDSQWELRRAPFLYGDADWSAPRARTTLDDMRSSYTTIYLRHRFVVDGQGSWKRLFLEIVSDDGFVAYINGREIGRARAGLPGAPLEHDAVASSVGPEPPRVEVLEIDPGVLHPRENVLAIHALNRALDSRDFLLAASCVAGRDPDPARDRDLLASFEAASSARREDPSRGVCLEYLRARLLAREGRHGEAIARLRRLLERDPENVRLRCRLIEALRAVGESPEARRVLGDLVSSVEIPFDPRSSDLNNAAWAIVTDPRRDLERDLRALLWARRSCETIPFMVNRFNTLAGAQLRVGLHEKALETLGLSLPANRIRLGYTLPEDLAFLALARHGLGQIDGARDALNRLRAWLSENPCREVAQLSLLREAERAIEGAESD